MRTLCIITLMLTSTALISGCAGTPSRPTAHIKHSIISSALESQTERRNLIEDNWSMLVQFNFVTSELIDAASAIAHEVKPDGSPSAAVSTAFHVFYLHDSGPYVWIQNHTYSGSKPTVAVDGHSPIALPQDGSVSVQTAPPELIDLMLQGAVIRGRYGVRSQNDREFILDLRGFPQAWERLQVSARRRSAAMTPVAIESLWDGLSFSKSTQ